MAKKKNNIKFFASYKNIAKPLKNKHQEEAKKRIHSTSLYEIKIIYIYVFVFLFFNWQLP